MTNQHGYDDADKHEDFSDTPIIPGPDNPDPDGLFIAEVQGRNKRLRQLIQFTHSSTKAAAIMLLAAIVALVVANTPARFSSPRPSSRSWWPRRSPASSASCYCSCRPRPTRGAVSATLRSCPMTAT